MTRTRKPRGFGLYVVTVYRADGSTDAWRESHPDQAIAAARTWSLKADVAGAEVSKEGVLRARYEDNVEVAAQAGGVTPIATARRARRDAALIALKENCISLEPGHCLSVEQIEALAEVAKTFTEEG